MSSRRVLKAAQAIREVVGMAIIADLKDPRIRDVTVTLVEVSPDMRMAKVNVSVMGDETKQQLCLRGLQSSAGYLQQKVGKRIDTRYTPRIQFVLDEGIKHSMLVTKILEEVLPKENESVADESADSEGVVDSDDASTGIGMETDSAASVDSDDISPAPESAPASDPTEPVTETPPPE
ncbi:MAG: 30S ribosome-binding factor RbfA [Mariniblastus sp.]